MFIVIEGIDLVGKTTQHEMLSRYLRDRGFDVAVHSFPAYGSPTGEVIREHLRGSVALASVDGREGSSVSDVVAPSAHDALAFQCLQVVDKYAVATEITRELREGRTVVACRWWQSVIAYGL